MKRLLVVSALVLGQLACPAKQSDKKPTEPVPARRDGGVVGLFPLPPEDAAAIVLPPAPPLPAIPPGLPPAPALPGVTPEAVALGELLFHDKRLSRAGTHACATCHAPAAGYAGRDRAINADGKPNLRRPPALVNLAWVKELGWDGRYPSMTEHLIAHVRGQLGQPIETAVERLAELAVYRAHLARVGGVPRDAALQALGAFARTRYAGDAPWDRVEPTARVPTPGATPDPIVAGYVVFAGAGQCAVCHPPPLYTDGGFHRVTTDAFQDPGRGAVDRTKAGAFKTPTLRGAAARVAFMHTASLTSLEQVVDGYAMGATTSDDRPLDPAIASIRLTAQQRADLLVFLRALTSTSAAPIEPILP